jgi:hypothetical protein
MVRLVPGAASANPSHLAWTAAFLAWLLAVPLFFVTKFITVIAHEGGHAIIATLLFQKVLRIDFNRRGGGETSVAAPIPWLFHVAFLAAGYVGPSMFGLLGAEILLRGTPGMVLWTSLAFLLAMLFVVRGPLGFILVPSFTIAIIMIMAKTHPPQQVLLTHMWVWFLLISPVQRMFLLMRRKDYQLPGNDTARLGELAILPKEIWSLAFLAATIAALVYGGSLMLRQF